MRSSVREKVVREEKREYVNGQVSGRLLNLLVWFLNDFDCDP